MAKAAMAVCVIAVDDNDGNVGGDGHHDGVLLLLLICGWGIHTYIQHTHMHAYMLGSRMHANMHTHTHTYIHTCIYAH